MSHLKMRSEDELEVLKALRQTGSVTLNDIGVILGGITRERVRQLIPKSRSASNSPIKIDPIRIIKVLRTNRKVTSVNKLHVVCGGGYHQIVRFLCELGLETAARRLFRMRRYLKKQEIRRAGRERIAEKFAAYAMLVGHNPSLNELMEAKPRLFSGFYNYFDSIKEVRMVASLPLQDLRSGPPEVVTSV